jgi:hypothetical protein
VVVPGPLANQEGKATLVTTRTNLVIATALVLAVLVAAGCGGGGVSAADADKALAKQVESGLVSKLNDKTVDTYSADVSCIAENSGLTRFKCLAKVINVSDSADVSVAVTCEKRAEDCIWETNN